MNHFQCVPQITLQIERTALNPLAPVATGFLMAEWRAALLQEVR